MNNIIYVDLLVIINLYITFFLLKATLTFLHKRVSNKRIVLSSLIGGGTSLMVLIPHLPFALNGLLRILAGLLIVFLAFGYKNRYEYFKNALFFLIINVVFAGFTLVLWFFVAPLGMEWSGGVLYFDISLPTLIITTALAYGLIRLMRYILDVKHAGSREYTITIVTKSGNVATLSALADSGNMLTDYFTGLSVIVLNGESNLDFGDVKPRLLPYNTIDSAGLISVYRVERIVIKAMDEMPYKSEQSVNALIGIPERSMRLGTDCTAIFNPRLLI
ncbi:MAG: sigma-E processing peptidase SpoIIGA [Oscillospiraceae bacterium]|nr:sigma-E processing peptidase SpoIIGA [Oscillospiraceae bacterium]